MVFPNSVMFKEIPKQSRKKTDPQGALLIYKAFIAIGILFLSFGAVTLYDTTYLFKTTAPLVVAGISLILLAKALVNSMCCVTLALLDGG